MKQGFRVVDAGLRDGRFNVALDQAMIELHQAARIPDTIRFIHFPPTALVGRHQVLSVARRGPVGIAQFRQVRQKLLRDERPKLHPRVTIEENDFEDFDWANQNLLTIARDFVLAADVTWSSGFAESGCGFAVRNDGDEENPSQYLIGLTRGAQGHVLFAEQVAGDVDLNQVTDIYANGIDPQFEWQNDTTNRIAIVGQGQQFTIYSNGTRLGTITGQSGFEEGFVAFFALNRSGGVRCDFDNAWLWRMN